MKNQKKNISADTGEFRVALISLKVLTLWESEIDRERERDRSFYTQRWDYSPFISDGDQAQFQFPFHSLFRISSFLFYSDLFFIFFEYSNLVARSVPVVNLGFLCFKLASICFHVFSYDVLGFDLFLYITVIRSQYLQITLDTDFLFNNSKLCHNDSEIA